MNSKNITHFRCEVLHTIGRLWVEHSNGRFGFSVQKRIYKDLQAAVSRQHTKIWDIWAEQVGWQQNGEWLYYQNMNFAMTAPPGHLPRWFWFTLVFREAAFFSRLDACEI